MKILMLHNRYLVPGGEDQCSVAEAALLRDHGHEVELLEEDNRRIEQLGQARTAMRTVWSRESYRRIDELLRVPAPSTFCTCRIFSLYGLRQSITRRLAIAFPLCRPCTTTG